LAHKSKRVLLLPGLGALHSVSFVLLIFFKPAEWCLYVNTETLSNLFSINISLLEKNRHFQNFFQNVSNSLNSCHLCPDTFQLHPQPPRKLERILPRFSPYVSGESIISQTSPLQSPFLKPYSGTIPSSHFNARSLTM